MLPMMKDAEQAPEIFKVLFHECNDLVALPYGGVTAVILEAAAGSLKPTAPELLQVMLGCSGNPLPITKSVIIAAAANPLWMDQMLKILCLFNDEARQICHSMGGDPKSMADEVS
jgi:hypothetical protein